MAIWVLLIILFPYAICSSSYAIKPSAFPSSFIQQLIAKTKNTQKPYNQKYFTQILDHFNYGPAGYHTFQQRYLINDTHWGGAAKSYPIFVYTGNEGEIEWFAQNTGFMFEIAPRFKALLIFIEHRFYGESIPYGASYAEILKSNSSMLGYLSSTQALADYATLILDLKKNLTATNSPVFVFGGSYGGMLAAWFRLKYPHVAMGALASSAPLLNFDNITSPYSFNNIITQDFRSVSKNCYKVIKRSWHKIEEAAAKSGGLNILMKSFRICKNNTVNTNITVDDIVYWISNAYTYVAMTDYPIAANFINPLPAYPIKEMCKAIDDPKTGNNTFKKIYGAMNIYYNYSGDAKCFNLLDYSDPHGMDLWSWQACTELVLATSGSTKDSMFPAYKYNYNDQTEHCKDAYNITPRPTWIPTEFGGRDRYRDLKRFGSNIIFSNGLRDPWSGGGVLKNLSENIIAIVAEKGAHHADLRFSTKEDPKWLQDIRNEEVQIMSKWIIQYYQDLGVPSPVKVVG